MVFSCRNRYTVRLYSATKLVIKIYKDQIHKISCIRYVRNESYDILRNSQACLSVGTGIFSRRTPYLYAMSDKIKPDMQIKKNKHRYNGVLVMRLGTTLCCRQPDGILADATRQTKYR
jgi:hypothetical protein